MQVEQFALEDQMSKFRLMAGLISFDLHFVCLEKESGF